MAKTDSINIANNREYKSNRTSCPAYSKQARQGRNTLLMATGHQQGLSPTHRSFDVTAIGKLHNMCEYGKTVSGWRGKKAAATHTCKASFSAQ